MTETKTAEAAPQPVSPDVEKIALALFAPEEGKAKKDAREAVKKMTGTWEFLPVRLRSAIRSDVERMVKDGKSVADIVAAGYSATTVARAMRDLGLRR